MMKTSSPHRAHRLWPTLAAAVALAALVLVGCQATSPGARGTVREFLHIHGLAFDPTEPDTLLLATHQGLIRMAAGTAEWQYAGRARPDLMGFSVSLAEPGVFFSSGHPGQGLDLPNPVGLIVSRDGGRTWQPVSLTGEVDFHVLTVSPADPRLLVGWFDGQLYRSEDGGHTWHRSRPGALTAAEPFQLAAHPRNRQELLAATPQGLFRSQDLGETWTPVLPGTFTAVAYSPGQPDRIFAYQVGRGLIHSEDGGRTWQPAGYVAGERDAVAFITVHPKDPRRLAIGTFQSQLFHTADGGAAWQELARSAQVVR